MVAGVQRVLLSPMLATDSAHGFSCSFCGYQAAIAVCRQLGQRAYSGTLLTMFKSSLKAESLNSTPKP